MLSLTSIFRKQNRVYKVIKLKVERLEFKCFTL